MAAVTVVSKWGKKTKLFYQSCSKSGVFEHFIENENYCLNKNLPSQCRNNLNQHEAYRYYMIARSSGGC